MTTGRINKVAFINQGNTTSYSLKHKENVNRRRLDRHLLCNQKSSWKTDETRPRPHKHENLMLRTKRSAGKVTGKFPGKVTGDSPAIGHVPGKVTSTQQSIVLHQTLGHYPYPFGLPPSA
ncbi:hypothetical protein YC2023_040373 [Brassica napus]